MEYFQVQPEFKQMSINIKVNPSEWYQLNLYQFYILVEIYH
jgi:hypothetical protein